jgi:hypothetical protein
LGTVLLAIARDDTVVAEFVLEAFRAERIPTVETDVHDGSTGTAFVTDGVFVDVA